MTLHLHAPTEPDPRDRVITAAVRWVSVRNDMYGDDVLVAYIEVGEAVADLLERECGRAPGHKATA